MPTKRKTRAQKQRTQQRRSIQPATTIREVARQAPREDAKKQKVNMDSATSAAIVAEGLSGQRADITRSLVLLALIAGAQAVLFFTFRATQFDEQILDKISL